MRDITFDPRQVGEVMRYHTWKRLRDQSVGEHTWQILRILLTVWPGAPRRVMIYTIVHDMGEMYGDISYPFKKLIPQLKTGATAAEAHVIAEMRKVLGVPRHNHLSPYEIAVFKLCEYIEMWEYGLNEQGLGNKYAELVSQRCMVEIGAFLHKLEHELNDTQDAKQHPDIPAAVHRYILTRMKMESDE
jgi:hypothetical protein